MEGPAPSQDEIQGGVAVATPDQAFKNSIEGQPQRVSAEDADKARAEKEAQATKLMDDMEASAEAQGQYFVKLGEKKPITEPRERQTGFLGRKTETYDETVGHEDTRALILRAPVTHEFSGTQRTDFIVATPDGLRVLAYYPDSQNMQDRPEYDFISAFTKGEKVPGQYSKFTRNGNTWYKTGLEFSDKESGYPTNIRLESAPPDVLEIFQESLQKSIAMVEPPHAKNAQQAIADTKVIQGADSMIGGLPPRP